MNTLLKTMLCGVTALLFAGASAAQNKQPFISEDFSAIQSPNDNPSDWFIGELSPRMKWAKLISIALLTT